jgi:hypothetical protein
MPWVLLRRVVRCEAYCGGDDSTASAKRKEGAARQLAGELSLPLPGGPAMEPAKASVAPGPLMSRFSISTWLVSLKNARRYHSRRSNARRRSASAHQPLVESLPLIGHAPS